MSKQQYPGLSRRDVLNISGRFGLTSTLVASSLARAAEGEQQQRYQTESKFQLRFGASGFNANNLNIQKSGQLFFGERLRRSVPLQGTYAVLQFT